MSAPRRAFTVLELLIVISIIAVLIALLLPMMNSASFRAKILQTTQRMEAIQAALLALGGENGSTAYSLQRQIDIGGTREFELDSTINQGRPAGAAPWHACYPDPQATGPAGKLAMAYPWGKARQYWIREPWYTGAPQNLPTTDPGDPTMTQAMRDAWFAAWRQPEAHKITELWPRNTVPMLRLCGILIGADEASAVESYKDRGVSRAFNDAWGHPLVVAHALYQPTRCQIGGRYPQDYYLKEGLAQYQYNRSVYIAVAACGPMLNPTYFASGFPNTASYATYADWEPTVQSAWDGACEACLTGSQPMWDETSFDRPPWKGARLGDQIVGGRRLRGLIMAPVEMK